MKKTIILTTLMILLAVNVTAWTTPNSQFASLQEKSMEEYSFHMTQKGSLEGYLFHDQSIAQVGNNVNINLSVNVTVFNFFKDAFQNPTMAKCLKLEPYVQEEYPIFNCALSTHRDILVDRLGVYKNNGIRLIRDGIDAGFTEIVGSKIIINVPISVLKNKGLLKIGEGTIIYEYQNQSMITYEYTHSNGKYFNSNVTLKRWDNTTQKYEIKPHDIFLVTHNETRVINDTHNETVEVFDWKFGAIDSFTGSNLAQYQYEVISNQPLVRQDNIWYASFYKGDRDPFNNGNVIYDYEGFDFSDISDRKFYLYNETKTCQYINGTNYSCEFEVYQYPELSYETSYIIEESTCQYLNETNYTCEIVIGYKLLANFWSNGTIDPLITESSSTDWNEGLFNQTEVDVNSVRLRNKTVDTLLRDWEMPITSATHNITNVFFNQTDLMFYMRLNNDSSIGETNNLYVSSNNNGINGSSSNVPVFDSTSKFAGGWDFDGSNDDIELTDNLAFDTPTNQITVSAWVYRQADQASFRSVVSRHYLAGNDNHWILGFNSNSNIWYVGPVGSVLTGSVALDNQWFHYAGTYNGTHMVIYVNGKQDAITARAGSFTTGSETVTIGNGRNGGSFTEPLNAIIDEVAVWNRTLSADEVRNLYLLGARYYNNGTFTSQILEANKSLTTNSTFESINWSINYTNPSDIDNTNISMRVRVSGNYNDTDNDLVLSLHMDNNSAIGENNTFVVDESGKGNNGTTINQAKPSSSGKFNRAFEFDGSGDYINGGADSSLDLHGSLTVSAWFNYRSDSVGNILYGDYGTGEELYNIVVNQVTVNTVGFVYRRTGGVGYWRLSSPISKNTWHHVAAVLNADNSVDIYINGVLDNDDELGTTGTPMASPLINFTIGRAGNFDGQYFNGSIDEIKIWNRSLTSTEISNLYNNSRQAFLWGNYTTYSKTNNFTNINQSGRWIEYQTLHETNDLNITPYLIEVNINTSNRTVSSADNPPTVVIGNNDSVETKIGGSVLFTCNYTDDIALSSQIFMHNQTGTLTNISNSTISGTTNQTNHTVSVTLTKGQTFCSQCQTNDSSNQWTTSSQSCVTVANSAPTFDFNLTAQSVNTDQNLTYDINCSDADSDTITYFDNTTLFNINSTSGLISHDPDVADIGSHTINITCGDGEVNISQSFIYTITSATQTMNFTIVDENLKSVFDIDHTGHMYMYDNFSSNSSINVDGFIHENDSRVCTADNGICPDNDTTHFTNNGTNLFPVDPSVDFNINNSLFYVNVGTGDVSVGTSTCSERFCVDGEGLFNGAPIGKSDSQGTGYLRGSSGDFHIRTDHDKTFRISGWWGERPAYYYDSSNGHSALGGVTLSDSWRVQVSGNVTIGNDTLIVKDNHQEVNITGSINQTLGDALINNIAGSLFFNGTAGDSFDIVTADQDIYYQVVGLNSSVFSNGITPNTTNSSFTIDVSGVYDVFVKIDARSSQANNYEFEVWDATRTTHCEEIHTHRTTSNANAVGSGADSGYCRFNKGDTVALFAIRRNGGAVSKTITVEHIKLKLMRVFE